MTDPFAGKEKSAQFPDIVGRDVGDEDDGRPVGTAEIAPGPFVWVPDPAGEARARTLGAYALNLLAGATLEPFERVHLLGLAAEVGATWGKPHDALVAAAAAHTAALEAKWRDIGAVAARRALAGRPGPRLWTAVLAGCSVGILLAWAVARVIVAITRGTPRDVRTSVSTPGLWDWSGPGVSGTIPELAAGERAVIQIFDMPVLEGEPWCLPGTWTPPPGFARCKILPAPSVPR